ncbi:hypothetical protein [Streptomyces celluloflavus]|uniref:hypothetical protein n=1 Tax=Streptomyces celluloflavus TaxID=58344 RepID=UPI0036D106DD
MLLNPRITERSDEADEQFEGCLSFFDVRGMVPAAAADHRGDHHAGRHRDGARGMRHRLQREHPQRRGRRRLTVLHRPDTSPRPRWPSASGELARCTGRA